MQLKRGGLAPVLLSKACKKLCSSRSLHSIQAVCCHYIQINSETLLPSTVRNTQSSPRKGQESKLKATSCGMFFNILLQLPLLKLFDTLKETVTKMEISQKRACKPPAKQLTRACSQSSPSLLCNLRIGVCEMK